MIILLLICTLYLGFIIGRLVLRWELEQECVTIQFYPKRKLGKGRYVVEVTT